MASDTMLFGGILELLAFLPSTFIFPMKKVLLPWLVLMFLIVSGAYLRFSSIGAPSLWIDEGFTITQTNAIAQHGYPLLESGFIEKKDVLLPYLLAPFSERWDAFNPTLPRSIVALFGIASIAITFLIGKTVQGTSLAIVFASIIAFSYWHIAWSRQIRGYEPAAFFLLLTIYFLALSTQTRKTIYTRFAVFSIVLATLAKSFCILFFPSIILFFFLSSKDTTSRIRSLLPTIIAGSILSSFLFFLFLQGKSIDHPVYLTSYIFGYLWLSFGILLPLTLFGWVQQLRKSSSWQPFHFALGLFFIVTLVFFSFFSYAQEGRYLFLTTPLLFLYASLAIISLGISLPLRRWVGILVVLGILITLDQFTVKSFLLVPRNFFPLEYGTPQPPFRDAYAFLKDQIQPDDTLVSSYPFMDILYLGRSTYSIPLSYTGRIDESTIQNKREYYSGTPDLFAQGKEAGREKLVKLSQQHSVYIIMDSLALRRIDSRFISFLQQNGTVILESSTPNPESGHIFIYRLWMVNSINES